MSTSFEIKKSIAYGSDVCTGDDGVSLPQRLLGILLLILEAAAVCSRLQCRSTSVSEWIWPPTAEATMLPPSTSIRFLVSCIAIFIFNSSWTWALWPVPVSYQHGIDVLWLANNVAFRYAIANEVRHCIAIDIRYMSRASLTIHDPNDRQHPLPNSPMRPHPPQRSIRRAAMQSSRPPSNERTIVYSETIWSHGSSIPATPISSQILQPPRHIYRV